MSFLFTIQSMSQLNNHMMSLWQIAQAISFTFTSPRSGSAMATSSIESGWPTSRHTAAFNFFSSRTLYLSAFHGNIEGKGQAKPVTRAHARQNIPPEPSVSAGIEDRRESQEYLDKPVPVVTCYQSSANALTECVLS